MNRRGAGVMFCLIAAMLYSTKYLSAAIFGSDLGTTWSEEIFNLSVISFVLGIIYLISADLPDILAFCKAYLKNEENRLIKEYRSKGNKD